MKGHQLGSAVRSFAFGGCRPLPDVTDGALLGRYAADRDESAHSALDIKTYAMALLGTDYRESTKRNMPKFWFDDLPHTHVALDDARARERSCNMLAERDRLPRRG